MPTSSLILTLSDNPHDVEDMLAAIAEDQRITLGPRMGQKLPIVLETDSKQQDKHYWQRLQEDKGIIFIDVACVFFDPPSADHQGGSA